MAIKDSQILQEKSRTLKANTNLKFDELL